MRIEQLVLFGPGEDFRVQFADRLTVLAGLAAEEREDLIGTLVDALTGRLPNASVIYSDHAGRRVFADRTGATYADDGTPAPSLSTLLGTDPNVVRRLVTMGSADLGLDGSERTANDISAELAAARAADAQRRAERDDVKVLVDRIGDWQDELAELDERIDRAEDDAARWSWTELRRQLAAKRAELGALDGDDGGDADRLLLATVDELRATGESWASASTSAAELADQLGTLPEVDLADLTRVAATPEMLPDDFSERLAAWQLATEVHRAREADLVATTQPAPVPDDAVTLRLAKLDQTRLWGVADALVAARSSYEAELAALADETDPDIEHAIEEAHRGVLACERDRQRRFVPGVLGSAILAVGALLGGNRISVFLGIVMLVAAVAMGWWLLVTPRRTLAEAQREEEMALGRADAGSWLGLHLRRIDDVMSPNDRKGLDAAVDTHAAAQLDWEELAGADLLVADALERRDAVRAHAEATDPAARTRRRREVEATVATAAEAGTMARSRLTEGLDGYGLTASSAVDLDPAQLRSVLEGRISGGALARRAIELRTLEAEAEAAGTLLESVLSRLGIDAGLLEARLATALEAVDAAKQRRQALTNLRPRDEVESEITALVEDADAQWRPSWTDTPEPTDAPPDPDRLVTRRLEVGELVRTSQGPDLVDAERRLDLATDRVTELEAELDALADGPTPLQTRITDRLARTSLLNGHDDRLPVVIDDAVASLGPAEKELALDLLSRLSSRTQVILLTADLAVTTWARTRVPGGVVTLLESEDASR